MMILNVWISYLCTEIIFSRLFEVLGVRTSFLAVC